MTTGTRLRLSARIALGAVLLGGSVVSGAAADTARLVPEGTFDGSTRGTIVITDTAGRQRTLGPVSSELPLQGLTRSPDGRWFAVLGGSRDLIGAITIVPAAGGDPFSFLLGPAGPVATVATAGQISWSSDGRELVVGYASTEGEAPGFGVLRCSVESRACSAVPSVSGMATAVPGGIVSVTGYGELVPTILPRTDTDDRLRPSQLRDLRRPRTARITLTTDAGTRTVGSRRASALDGLHGAVRLLGGPSGALLVQQRYRATLVRQRRGWTVRERSGGYRWAIVAPDGRTRVLAAPRLTVPQAHGAVGGRGGRVGAQRATVWPAVGRSSGGWLGTVGHQTYPGGGDGLVLAQISASGRVALTRTGGALASATTLVRRLGFAAVRGTSSLSVIAHEASTDAAIVLLEWTPKPRSRGQRRAVVRVPLDGRTAPTAIRADVTELAEIEQVAW